MMNMNPKTVRTLGKTSAFIMIYHYEEGNGTK
jgi:hypothetical protein